MGSAASSARSAGAPRPAGRPDRPREPAPPRRGMDHHHPSSRSHPCVHTRTSCGSLPPSGAPPHLRPRACAVPALASAPRAATLDRAPPFSSRSCAPGAALACGSGSGSYPLGAPHTRLARLPAAGPSDITRSSVPITGVLSARGPRLRRCRAHLPKPLERPRDRGTCDPVRVAPPRGRGAVSLTRRAPRPMLSSRAPLRWPARPGADQL